MGRVNYSASESQSTEQSRGLFGSSVPFMPRSVLLPQQRCVVLNCVHHFGVDSRKVKLYQVEPLASTIGGSQAAESDVLDRGEVEEVDLKFNFIRYINDIQS